MRFYNRPKPKKTFTKLERRKLRSKACRLIRFVMRRDWKQRIMVTHLDAVQAFDKAFEKSLKSIRIEFSYPKLFRLFGL